MSRARTRTHRDGAVLLEVIVALAILATVASSAAWHTQEWMRAVQRTHAMETEIRQANRLLTAVSLWPKEDLERHLGVTVQGRWRLYIERTASSLYDVVLTDSSSGATLLRTAVFRDLHEAR